MKTLGWGARAARAALFALVVLGGTSFGCDQFGNTKMAQGQRYSSGDAKYDPYFESVHQQQAAASAWQDEKKGRCKGLVAALSLTPGATDDAVVSATRDRARKMGGGGARLDLAGPKVTANAGATADPGLFGAVEECARSEQERQKRLKATSDKLGEMAKQGESLRKDQDKEFENSGAQKADEAKQEKRKEIRRELGGSIEALRKLAREANRDAKEVDEFLADLGSALEAKDTPKRGRGSMGSDRGPSVDVKADTKPKDEPKPKDEAKPKDEPKAPPSKPAKGESGGGGGGKKPATKAPPSEKPATPPSEKPATPAPAPTKAPDEVFSP